MRPNKTKQRQRGLLHETMSEFLEYLRRNSQMVHDGEEPERTGRNGACFKKRFLRKDKDIKGKWQDKCQGVCPLPGYFWESRLGTKEVTLWVHQAQITKCPKAAQLLVHLFLQRYICEAMGPLSRCVPLIPKDNMLNGGCCIHLALWSILGVTALKIKIQLSC